MLNKDYFRNTKHDIKNLKLEKELMTELITSIISFDSSVEFSNVKYIDGKIAPTISQILAKEGKNATLLTPYIKTITSGNFNIVKAPKGYPFGNYGLITPSNVGMFNDGKIFIAENNVEKVADVFKNIASVGGTCIFAEAGNDIYTLIRNCEELRKKLEISPNSNITNELFAETKADKSAAILIIK